MKKSIDIIISLLIISIFLLVSNEMYIRNVISIMLFVVLGIPLLRGLPKNVLLFLIGLLAYFLTIVMTIPLIKTVRAFFTGPLVGDQKIVGYSQYFGYPFYFESYLFTAYIFLPLIILILIRIIVYEKN